MAPVLRTLKRVALTILGLVLLTPTLLSLLNWLFDQWQIYVVLPVVSFICYRRLFPGGMLGSARALSRGSVERVAYESGSDPIESSMDDWES